MNLFAKQAIYIQANRWKNLFYGFYAFYIDGRSMSSYSDGKASFIMIDVLCWGDIRRRWLIASAAFSFFSLVAYSSKGRLRWIVASRRLALSRTESTGHKNGPAPRLSSVAPGRPVPHKFLWFWWTRTLPDPLLHKATIRERNPYRFLKWHRIANIQLKCAKNVYFCDLFLKIPQFFGSAMAIRNHFRLGFFSKFGKTTYSPQISLDTP